MTSDAVREQIRRQRERADGRRQRHHDGGLEGSGGERALRQLARAVSVRYLWMPERRPNLASTAISLLITIPTVANATGDDQKVEYFDSQFRTLWTARERQFLEFERPGHPGSGRA